MSANELEETLTVLKWIYPIIAICFTAIVSLLLYIWKSHTTRTDTILINVTETLGEMKSMTAVHESEIRNLKGAVFSGKKAI